MSATEKRIEQVVDSILQDYQNDRTVDKIGGLRRPDRDEIVDIIEKLRRIIFPGYFRDKNYRFYNARPNLHVLIEDVMFHLTRQIRLVLQSRGQSEPEAAASAQEICLDFFEKIPAIRALVQTDLQAAYDGDPAAVDMAEIIFSYPGLFAVMVYRLAHELYLLDVPMVPRIMTEYAHNVTGIDIHPGATIGKFFFIDHGTGIVIGETTRIGDNVRIYQGVTLGALSTRGGQKLRGKQRHPIIEDDVTIYAGASILGGETVIGKGSVIGSNVFITESVAPGTSVRNKKMELQFKNMEEPK